MERRSAVATVALVLSLAALAAAGSCIASAPAPSETAGIPQPAPASMPEPPQAVSALPGGEAVAFAPGGMSGDFDHRLFVDAGALGAPSIYIPADRWRPRLCGTGSGRQLTPALRRMAVIHAG